MSARAHMGRNCMSPSRLVPSEGFKWQRRICTCGTVASLPLACLRYWPWRAAEVAVIPAPRVRQGLPDRSALRAQRAPPGRTRVPSRSAATRRRTPRSPYRSHSQMPCTLPQQAPRAQVPSTKQTYLLPTNRYPQFLNFTPNPVPLRGQCKPRAGVALP